MAHDDDRRRPDWGGHPLGGEPFDWDHFDWDHFVVPDDARELDDDVRAYQREQRAKAKRQRLGRFRLWKRYGAAAPIAIVLIVLVFLMASMMLVLPRPQTDPAAPVPLADPARADGVEGGLVPDVPIAREEGGNPSLRALRPAVVMLVPDGCECDGDVQDVTKAGQRHRLLTVLIGETVPDHPDDVARTNVVRSADPDGQLAEHFDVAGQPVLVTVRADGVIDNILTGVPSDSALSRELIPLDERPRQ